MLKVNLSIDIFVQTPNSSHELNSLTQISLLWEQSNSELIIIILQLITNIGNKKVKY